MASKMTHTTRAELANAVRRRYKVATGKQKRRILDEFIATTGYHEKSAIRVLNAAPTVTGRQTRSRPSLYDEAARAALTVLWEASDRVCGKRLRALLPILLPALERHGHLHLDEPIRSKVLAMSAARSVIGGTEVSSFLLMTVAKAQRALAQMSETVGDKPTEWRAMIALHFERHG
jgi:hypothetical protein